APDPGEHTVEGLVARFLVRLGYVHIPYQAPGTAGDRPACLLRPFCDCFPLTVDIIRIEGQAHRDEALVSGNRKGRGVVAGGRDADGWMRLLIRAEKVVEQVAYERA